MALLAAAARALLSTLVRWHAQHVQHGRQSPPQGVASSHSWAEMQSPELEAGVGSIVGYTEKGMENFDTVKILSAAGEGLGAVGHDVGDRPLGKSLGTVCAEELARVYSAVADHKEELSKYCSHLLTDYITLVLLPLPTTSDAGGAWMGDSEGGLMGALPREAAVALRGGAYALYSACGPAEVCLTLF